MTRSCGESSTMSRRLFIGSFFDGGLVDEHYRDVVADGIDALTLDAFQCVPIGLQFNFRLASRTREYFQEFLTNCHGLDLSKRRLRECGKLITKQEDRSYMTYRTYMTYTFSDV